MTEKIRAPWTPEQVAALNAFQQRGGMHPFTCGHEHPAHPDAVLEATPKGWRCFVLGCEYEQDWAHAFMADPDAWPKSPFGERHGPTPQEVSAAVRSATAHPRVQGRCPACNGSSLFLGTGGYVTCSRLDCPNPTLADDQLHRGRPDTNLREHLATALDTAFSDNYQPGHGFPTDEVTDAALTALTEQLDIGEAEAWCKICRRVWDGKAHQCEGDAEQRLARLRDSAASLHSRGIDAMSASFVLDIIDGRRDESARTTANNPPASETATEATQPQEQP
jgi:hypothetical protein